MTQREVQIKMPCLLNVSNGSSKPKEFSLNDIEVLVDNKEQNWFKRAHVGKFLGLVHIQKSTARKTRQGSENSAFLKPEGGCHNATPPREDAQDHDFVSGDWIQKDFDQKELQRKCLFQFSVQLLNHLNLTIKA